jgi:hypothetical protein
VQPSTITLRVWETPDGRYLQAEPSSSMCVGDHVLWFCTGANIDVNIVEEVETTVIAMIDEMLDRRWGITGEPFPAQLGRRLDF